MAVPTLVAIAGPTASGKSELALRIAHGFEGEIVNYDSVQVYRGFDIGSAKLPEAGRSGIPHHLIDIREPEDLFTAGDFIREAARVIQDISDAGRLPILCGGTGFYLRALLHGVSAVPSRNEDLRRGLLEREERRPGVVHRLLRRLDPGSAARIHPNDLNKSIRALEIRLATGRASTDVFKNNPPQPLSGYRSLLLGLNPPREELYRRINERCGRMWREGLVQEVESLLAKGVKDSAKPFAALGYKQALEFVQGKVTEAEALEEMRTRTRQYAKRQMTWFRAERDIEWLNGFGEEPAIQEQALQRVFAFRENSR